MMTGLHKHYFSRVLEKKKKERKKKNKRKKKVLKKKTLPMSNETLHFILITPKWKFINGNLPAADPHIVGTENITLLPNRV